MSQPDSAQEVVPVIMDWKNSAPHDFAPHILPADAPDEVPVEDVPDEVTDADFQDALDDGGEGESTGEEVDPKDSPASGSVTKPKSKTPATPSEF